MLAGKPSVKYVLGIEGRQENVDKARFVQQLLNVKNVQFITANLESVDLTAFGAFDAVFCSGLLYHLPEPWKLVEQMARVSPNLFLSTHYAPEAKADTDIQGLKGFMYQEHGYSDPLSGLSVSSFWPTLDSLQRMLTRCGYRAIHVMEHTPDFPNGPLINLAAQAS
jgi:SAM-dependent methyltransferase